MRMLRQLRLRRDHRWTPGQLSPYLDGELSAGARRRVLRHVDDCPECHGVLHSLRRMLDVLATMRSPEPVAEQLVLRFREAVEHEPTD